jgi:hypothetical protein
MAHPLMPDGGIQPWRRGGMDSRTAMSLLLLAAFCYSACSPQSCSVQRMASVRS